LSKKTHCSSCALIALFSATCNKSSDFLRPEDPVGAEFLVSCASLGVVPNERSFFELQDKTFSMTEVKYLNFFPGLKGSQWISGK
jgi:hypothetical protein